MCEFLGVVLLHMVYKQLKMTMSYLEDGSLKPYKTKAVTCDDVYDCKCARCKVGFNSGGRKGRSGRSGHPLPVLPVYLLSLSVSLSLTCDGSGTDMWIYITHIS